MDRSYCLCRIGIFEILDSFSTENLEHEKWKVNSYLAMREIVSYKMHASVCFFASCGPNGLIEGAITV